MSFYVTTSIPYVNGDPHIGFGMELIQADVLARYARGLGETVIFSTGTDEHGGKIAEKAATLKQTPQKLADEVSQNYRELIKTLNASVDRFVRTTDEGHVQRAQIIWKNLAGDIYEGQYSGWYCQGCEAFVTEATAKDNKGQCPIHKKPYQKLEEENYFFALSKYGNAIEQAITSNQLTIYPASRRNEILAVLKSGLEDISISRPKDKLSWGIAVPGDKDQVMYVWFEALMNYLTVIGYPEHSDFKNFWPANVQVIGKDIIRFHAAIWPGMLMALKLELPKILYVHGFITVADQKISKSLDNVIHPTKIVEKYGVDTFRYYFLRHIPSYEDGDFSWDKLELAYNNELANELGNAVQRTASMINQYQNGIIGEIPEPEHDIALYREAIEACRFDKALDAIWAQIRGLNQYIEEVKPWQLYKLKESEHLREVLAYQVSNLLEISDLLQPFLPDTAQKIRLTFEEGIVRLGQTTLFPRQDIKPSKTKANKKSVVKSG